MAGRRTAGAYRPPFGAAAVTLTMAILCTGCTEAPAHCRREVAASFERLRTSGMPYRKEMTIILEGHQVSQLTAEYIPPDRMHQITANRVLETIAHGIRFPAHETTSEVIRVGARAWEKVETGWHEWEAGLAQEIYDKGMDFLLLPDRIVPADAPFECLGVVEFKGTRYTGYRARLDKAIFSVSFSPAGPSDKERKELESRLQQMPWEWRTVLVDRGSGLPMYDLVAAESQLDKPTYSVAYTYPADIKIDPPIR